MSLYKIQKLSKETHEASRRNKKHIEQTKDKTAEILSDCESGSGFASFDSRCNSSSSSECSSVCEPDMCYSPVPCCEAESCEIKVKPPKEVPNFQPCERKCVPKCEHKHEHHCCKKSCESESEDDCDISDICPSTPCKDICPPEKPDCNFSPIVIKIKKPCKHKMKKMPKLKLDDCVPDIKCRKPKKIKPIKECKISFPSLPDCKFNFDCGMEEIEKPRIPHKAEGCCDKVKKFKSAEISKPKSLKKIRSDEVHQIQKMNFPTIKTPKY